MNGSGMGPDTDGSTDDLTPSITVEQGVITRSKVVRYTSSPLADFKEHLNILAKNAEEIMSHALNPDSPYRDHSGAFYITLPITARHEGDRTGHFKITTPGATRQPGGNPLPGSEDRLAVEPALQAVQKGRELGTLDDV